jgi:hypothetical protein
LGGGRIFRGIFTEIFPGKYVRKIGPRFGEFSQLGQLFTFGHFFEDYPNIWATFYHGKSHVSISTKFGWGYILGDFLTNSAGRAAKGPTMSQQFLTRF